MTAAANAKFQPRIFSGIQPSGGLTLDSLVQRLVQKNVWEIDNKYK